MKLDPKRVNSLFDMFNMSNDYLNREVLKLSGGEKQKIALIRSMVFMPKILLCDEITSALDTDNALIVEKILKSSNDDGMTILWVTHNPKCSRKYTNKMLTIDSGKIQSFEEV